jgi:prevent-host-death family protein
MSVKKEQTVRKAKAHEYPVDEQGTKKVVIVPIEEYEEFQELLEDLRDLEVVLAGEDESTITLEELKKRLEKDGLL